MFTTEIKEFFTVHVLQIPMSMCIVVVSHAKIGDSIHKTVM